MKHLVQHLVKNNLDEIVSKSLLNCHCQGLHSIMLLESPEKTIRLYISVPNSDMYMNNVHHVTFMKRQMSIGFHAHHCNVSLHCIKGQILNWIVEPSYVGIELSKYRYHSGVTKQLKFEKLENHQCISTLHTDVIRAGHSVYMDSNEIHTVGCPKNELCAWFVYEGKEDKNYDNVLWTNADLNTQDYSGLYQKPTQQQVLDLLKSVELI